MESATTEAQNRLRKQNYLIEKIMDRGYDVEAFTGFMCSQKAEGGMDVDSYTYDEIVSVSQC